MQGTLEHMILESSPASDMIQVDEGVEAALECGGMLGSQGSLTTKACPEEGEGRG